MTQYAILIYSNESQRSATPEDFEKGMKAHGDFAAAVVEMGVKILGGEGLEPTSTATSIRDGVVTDGPFVETKEVFGGFYLIDARDLDQAIEVAKLCPAHGGGVEVRPVMDTSGE